MPLVLRVKVLDGRFELVGVDGGELSTWRLPEVDLLTRLAAEGRSWDEELLEDDAWDKVSRRGILAVVLRRILLRLTTGLASLTGVDVSCEEMEETWSVNELSLGKLQLSDAEEW